MKLGVSSTKFKFFAIFAVAFFCFFFSAHSASATAKFAVASGNWSATSGVWALTSCATGAGNNVPTSSDAVTICNGVTVTVDGADVASSITVNAPTTANGITISGTNTLTVTNAITMNAPTAGVNDTIAVGAGTLSSVGITINGGGSSGFNSILSLSTGTITTTGGISFGGTVAQAQLTTTDVATINLTGTISSGGTLSINSGTLLKATGSSTINISSSSTNWGKVQVNTGTLGLGAAFTVATGLQIDSGATLSAGANLVTDKCASTGLSGFTINGTLSGSGGVTLDTASCTLDGTGSVTNTGTFTMTNDKTIAGTASLTVGGSASASTISAGTTITNNGTFIFAGTGAVTGGNATTTIWINAANSTLKIAGTAFLATGVLTATASGNTVDYNNSAGVATTQTLFNTTYYNFNFGGTSTKALPAGGIQVTNTLSVSSGITATLSTGDFLTTNLTVTGSGIFTGTGRTITMNGNGVGTAGRWLHTTGAGQIRTNLTFNSAGNITLGDGTTGSAGTVLWGNFGSTLTWTAGTMITTNSTLNLHMDNAPTISTNGMKWNNVTLLNTGGGTLTLGSDLDIGGNLTWPTTSTATTFVGANRIITLQGNLVMGTSSAATNAVASGASTQTIKMNASSGAQTWSGQQAISAIRLTVIQTGSASFAISGTVTLATTGFTITSVGSGGFSAAGSTLNSYNNVIFNTSGSTYPLYNVTTWDGGNTIPLSSNLYMTGNLVMNGNTNGSNATTTWTGPYSVTVGGNLTQSSTSLNITGSTSGGNVFLGIIMNGTGTWSNAAGATSVMTVPLTFNTSGTITIGSSVYYSTGTLLYTLGTIDTSANSSTLNIAGSATLNTPTASMSWYNLNQSTTGTLTLTSAITISNTLSVASGVTETIATSNITTVNLTVTNTGVFSGNGRTITVSGRWSHTQAGSGKIRCNITLTSTATISGTVYFTGDSFPVTLTGASGVTTTGSILDIDASVTLNTSTMSFQDITHVGSIGTLTLTSDLNINGNWTMLAGAAGLAGANTNIYLKGNLNMAASGSVQGLSTQILYMNASSGTQTWSGAQTWKFTKFIVIQTGTAAFTMSGSLALDGGTFTFTSVGSGGFTNTSTVTMLASSGNISLSSASSSYSFNNVTMTLSANNITLLTDIYILGNLAINGTASTPTIGAFTLYVAGNLSQGGTSTNVTGTVGIVMNGSGTWSNTVGATSVMQVPLTFNTSGTITLSGNLYYSTGTLTYTAGTLSPGSSTLNIPANTTFAGGMSGSNAFNNIAVSAGTLTNNATAGTTGLAITGNLTGAGALTQGTNSILTLGGTSTITTLTANTTGNTVIYNGTAGQTVKVPASSTYMNLTINDSGQTATLGGAITVSGNLAINTGTLDDNGTQITGNATNNLTMASGTTLKIGIAGTATTFPTLYTTGHTTLNSASTVIYNAGVTQTISSTPAYGNLQLSRASGTPTKSLNGTTTINGSLTIDASNTLSAGANQIALGGNYSNSGTFTAGTGTFLLSGSVAQTLSGTMTSGSAFYDLTITNSSGASASDCGLTGFTAGIIFGGSATSTHNYVITTANVRVTYNAGSTYTFANINWSGQASGTKIYFRSSSAGSAWNLNVSGTQTAVSYIDVSDSDAHTGSSINSDTTVTDCNNNTNWVFIMTISGTANGNDGGTVKVAFNNSIDAHTTTISGGAWTISNITKPAAGVIVTVFVDGATLDSNETTAITKYSSGVISGMVLNTNVLTIGSNQNTSLTTTNLGQYTSSNDEDVMQSVSSGALSVQGTSNTYVNPILAVLNNNTLTVDSASTESITTGQLYIYGSATLTATGTPTITLNGTSGTLFTNSGTFTPATSTVTLSGNGDATINSGAITFYNLTSSGTGVKSVDASSALTFATSGTLTVSGGTFDPVTALVASGSNTLTASAVLRVEASTFAGSYPAGFGTLNLNSGSTVDYHSSGAQTISSTISPYYNLTTSTGGTKTLGGNVTISNVLTIGASSTLSASSNNITLSGTTGTPFIDSGTFSSGTGTVSYTGNNGSGNTTVLPETYHDLTLNNASETYVLGGATTINNLLTITDGTLDTDSTNHYNFSTSDILIDTSGTLLGRASNITVTENWVNTGTFTRGTSTVLLNGDITDNIAGDTNFNNLTISSTVAKTVYFTTTGTTSVYGIFTVTGHNSQLISLLPELAHPTTQFPFRVISPGTASISYINVSYGGCAATAINMSPVNSVDGGNNDTCWSFGIAISGTANGNDGETVKIAINGTADSHTTTISSGAWSFTTITQPSSGDIVTVWVEGASAPNKTTAITKYSSGSVSGMVLDTNTLTVGDAGGVSLAVSDFSHYTSADDSYVMHSYSSGDLSVAGTNPTLKILSGNTLTASTGESVTTGKIDNAGTITVTASNTPSFTLNGTSGTLFTNSGTFTPASSTVTLSGNGDATVNSGAITFYNLTNSGTGVKSLGDANITVNHNMTVSGGTFDPTASRTITGSGTNTLAVSSGATIRAEHSLFSGDWISFEITTLSSGSTVDYYLNNAQTIDNTLSYSNLNLSNSGTKTLGGDTTIANVLTVGSSATLDGSSHTLTLSGATGTPFVDSGTFTSSTGTVSYTGNYASGNTTVLPETYHNLTLNNASETYVLNGTTPINNLLTITAGTLDTVSHNFSTSDITIGASGMLNANASIATVTENWTNNGTFNSGTSTVLMNGDNAHDLVAGTTSFYNLTITTTTPSVAKEVDFPSTTTTVMNAFNVTGHGGALISLYSTPSPTKWNFYPMLGTNNSVRYAKIKDGGCANNAIAIRPANSVDDGNNDSCWVFSPYVYKLTNANTVEVYNDTNTSNPSPVKTIQFSDDYALPTNSLVKLTSLAVDTHFNRLYVTTDDPSAGLKVVDISNPSPSSWVCCASTVVLSDNSVNFPGRDVYVDSAGVPTVLGATSSKGGIFVINPSTLGIAYSNVHNVSDPSDVALIVHEHAGIYDNTATGFIYESNYHTSQLYIYPYSNVTPSVIRETTNDISSYGKPTAISVHSISNGNTYFMLANNSQVVHFFPVDYSTSSIADLVSAHDSSSVGTNVINDLASALNDYLYIAGGTGIYKIGIPSSSPASSFYVLADGFSSVAQASASGLIFGVSNGNSTLYPFTP